jgi:nucleotide-binding universal stress UspA family protein
MSIFPTKVLLATDGSEEASLAARTAADLAESTSSELHVVYAMPAARSPTWSPWITLQPRYVSMLSEGLGRCSTS